jgi:hypothetical protein
MVRLDGPVSEDTICTGIGMSHSGKNTVPAIIPVPYLLVIVFFTGDRVLSIDIFRRKYGIGNHACPQKKNLIIQTTPLAKIGQTHNAHKSFINPNLPSC